MEFTVYTQDGGGEDVEEFGGSSVYSVMESGALVVRPDVGWRTTYGPTGWLRVEEPADHSEADR